MRVIAGKAKGTRLYGVKGLKVRPILDSIKESLFEVLSEEIEGARVLDLFAGVGSIGIEALSRGAAHVDFIELDRKTGDAIKDNLERAGLSGEARVMRGRLPSALKRVRGPYGLIFMDPPFRIDARIMEELFRVVGGTALLDPGGIVVYRHSPRSTTEPPPLFRLLDRRDYGDSIISFYTAGESEAGNER